MDKCEFVEEILNYINEEDYRIMINQVYFQGLVIPGLETGREDVKWRPDVDIVNNDFVLRIKSRKSQKYNFEIIFEALVKIAKEKKDSDSILSKVVEWEEHPELHSKIEAFFKKLEEKKE